MRRPSILVPVIAGFGIVLLLLLSVTAIGVSHIRQISDRLTAIVAERNQKTALAATLHGLHESRYQALLLAASQNDAFARDEALMRFSRLAGQFIRSRDQFLGLPQDDAERRLWSELRDEVRRVELLSDQIQGLIRAGELAQARQRIRQVLFPLQQDLMANWDRLIQLQRDKNQAALTEAGTTRMRARNLSLALSGVALLVGVFVTVFVVRLSRRTEKDLLDEKERAQVTLHAIADGVVRFDAQGRVGFVNPMAEAMLGCAAREALGKPLTALLKLLDHHDQSDLTLRLVEAARLGRQMELPPTSQLLSAHGMEYEVEGKCSPIPSHEGHVEGGVLVLRDVTEIREIQRRLVWRADHDGTTGLANRRAFEDRLSRVLTSKRASEQPVSLVFIDLDQFRQSNEQAGRAAGDQLLRQLGRLLQSRVRESDLLARLDGDEFALMLLACPPAMAEKIAGVLLDSVAHLDFAWSGTAYAVAARIAVVHVRAEWATLDECLAAADAAREQARLAGAGRVFVPGRVGD
jgi:diguanylate cyclase (GGDEF)-like protein/PAS domain S-box-containing protein